MKKVTEEEYLNALDIMETYHIQFKGAISSFESEVSKLLELTLREFLYDVEVSVRLRNGLNSLMERNFKDRDVNLIEISEGMLCQTRNIGAESWNEFSRKRDEYIRERMVNVRRMPTHWKAYPKENGSVVAEIKRLFFANGATDVRNESA